MRSLRSEHVPFDPRVSHRTFSFCVVDAGLIKLLPPLVDRLHGGSSQRPAARPAARSRASRAVAGVRQARLRHGIVSVADQGHPSAAPVERAIRQRRAARSPAHLLGSDAARVRGGEARPGLHCRQRPRAPDHGTGTGGRNPARRTSYAASRCSSARPSSPSTPMPSPRCRCRSRPSSRSDLDLQIIKPPVKLPRIDIFQYWHDRFHRDPGNQWTRSIFRDLFRRPQST